MLGETISHYKIIEKLGEGGMGIVYRAVDTKLDREVAIKFLPPHLSSDPEAIKRFIHEAKAASAIDHSHIGTIHEIDEMDDGVTFIVMAHYDGETLRERMDRGELNVDEALDIASQIASGLSKAHQKDIVHRDIKPSNIIITSDGEVKIIDFGLAKLAGRTRLTKESSTLGTAAYMSPEQARGEEVDHRSDIFSLGVILYEMLADEPPFKGEHEAALLYEIVHENPEPLTKQKDNLPQKTQSIVDRALMKNASDRYNDLNEMLSDIDSINVRKDPAEKSIQNRSSIYRRKIIGLSAGLIIVIAILSMTVKHFTFTEKESSHDRVMIAVLPFANLGPLEDEYFSDGITDAITARLVSISALGVIARQSVIQYKDSDKSIQAIAEELGGVEYILEGTVQRDRPSDPNSTVRVIPQLIKVDDGIHVWAETYDEEMEQLFTIQSNIAEKVVEELNIVILGKERQTLRTRLTDNLRAYDYYLQGREYEERGIDHNYIEISIGLFSKAIEADTNFAVAYARLTLQHCRLYWHGYDRSIKRLNMAKEAIEHALALKPDEPVVRAANGYYYYYGLRDYNRALEEFTFALTKEPGNALYNASIGYIKRRMGKFEEGLHYLKLAYEYNPRSQLSAYSVGLTYLYLHKYTEAEDYCDRAVSLAPDIGLNYAFKAEIYINKTGRTEDARKVLEQALDRFSHTDHEWDLVYLDIFDGQYQDALNRLASINKELETRYSLYKPKNAIRGFIYELMGQTEQARYHYIMAREMLEEAVAGQPEDARIHAELCKIYAHLGLKDDAIREWRTVEELIPIYRDAIDANAYLIHLAAMHTILGDFSAALDTLESLPVINSYFSNLYLGALEINPIWDLLRGNTRFQNLLDKKSL